MTKVADCDLVFDVLTRGPFPTGEAHDAIVEQHLAACHECRQLAEALRPAVDLFHETLEPDGPLPSYQGPSDERMVGNVMTAVASVGAVAETKATREPTWGRSTWLPLMAVALGLTLFLTLAGSPGANEPPSTAPAAELEMVARFQPDAAGRELLSNLVVGPVCLPLHGKPDVVASAAKASYRCCTDCHVATIDQGSHHVPWSRFLQTCGACHDRLALSVEETLPQPEAG